MHDLPQTALFYVAPFLAVITVIVVIHELGHFLTARAFGVAVDRFSIGFGRAIVSWRDRAGVEWRIGWLPLGGYVKFAGDENIASVPDQTDLNAVRDAIVAAEGPGAELKYLPFKPLWQRALVVVAGPMANFLLATALFSILFGAFGEQVVSTRIDRVVPGSAAAGAGFLPGDRLLAVDGHKVTTFQDMQEYVGVRLGVPIDFTLDRLNRRLHLTATPTAFAQSNPAGGTAKVGRLGIEARGGAHKRYGAVEAVGRGAEETWKVASSTMFYLGRMVTGQASGDQLTGILGMAHASGTLTKDAVATAKVAGVGWWVTVSYSLIAMAALVSVSVGLLNLLPVPTLDGGHLLFYGYELITKHPPRAGIQAAGFRAGLALLVGLMLFATWNDLQRLRVFQFVGSLFS